MRHHGRDIRSEDEVNAVRHAMWNALMAKRAFDNPVTLAGNPFGGRLDESIGKAKEFADAHEDNPKNTDAVSKNMDLHNNEVGRQVARAVLVAFRDGRMVERSGNGLVTAR